MARVKVRYAPGADYTLKEFMCFLGDSLVDGDGTQSGGTVKIKYENTVSTITGVGLNISGAGAGTVETWKVAVNGKSAVTISNCDFSVKSLIAAVKAEDSGKDVFAFEKYYLRKFSWDYQGGDKADIARPTDKTSDGYRIDFMGADKFDLKGGNDQVGAGHGNDVVKGGDGDDKLWGEEGRDRLFGQDGDDQLFGGDDADKLDGGAGDDRLAGGEGNDRFLFKGNFGHDEVVDLDDGDRLDLRKAGVDDFSDVKAAAEDVAKGVLLTFDGGSILIDGVARADLDSHQFLV